MYKVEYYATEKDRRKDIRTTTEKENFEEAVVLFHSMVNNHNGAVKIIHPNVD